MESIAVADYYNEGIIICDNKSFQIKEKSDTSFKNLCCGDLSILGKIWIQALKTVLLGANFGLIPIVYASEPPPPPPPPKDPEKPPKMKFTDLPVYESPHADYNEFARTSSRTCKCVTCPGANDKILQSILLPYVSKLRETTEDAFSSVSCTVKCTLKDGLNYANDSKNQVKQYMRDPNNLQVRKGVVAGGTLVGYLLGGGGGIPRRVFYTGLGALAAGSLCFPKETDEIFRDVLSKTSKLVIVFYQTACRKQASPGSYMSCNTNDEPPLQAGCENKVEDTKKDHALDELEKKENKEMHIE